MADLLLIVTLAARRVALPAHSIEAVIEVDSISPAPGAAPHVAGLSALRSRVLTVIDGAASLGLPGSDLGRVRDAVVIPSEGHLYALLVDSVEDVVDAAGPVLPLRAPAGAGWEGAAIGMVQAETRLLLLADPHRLIAGPAALAA